MDFMCFYQIMYAYKYALMVSTKIQELVNVCLVKMDVLLVMALLFLNAILAKMLQILLLFTKLSMQQCALNFALVASS